jgi:putative membrane protein
MVIDKAKSDRSTGPAWRPPLVASLVWVAVYVIVMVWSGIGPKDRFTWILEVSPAWIAALLLGLSLYRFPLTPLVYVLILIHCIILMVGGHYTYAEVPWFDTLSEQFGWQRNNYDKLGHFAQGFVPALAAREIMLRLRIVARPWLGVMVVCLCLAVSAGYELTEWAVAVLSKEAAEAFLGTQGYVWDTQTDMFMALLGAVAALALFGSWHDRQLEKYFAFGISD